MLALFARFAPALRHRWRRSTSKTVSCCWSSFVRQVGNCGLSSGAQWRPPTFRESAHVGELAKVWTKALMSARRDVVSLGRVAARYCWAHGLHHQIEGLG